jgi:hydrogenase maturation factor
VATGHADHVALFACNQAAAGQDLILTKWIGLEGTAMLAEEKAREICNRYPAHMVEEAVRFGNYLSIASEAAVAAKSGASAMHDVSGGGIFAALWEMAEGAGTGLEVDLKKIPVKQETIEICEFFEINPYQLISGGALLIAAADGKEMVRRLQEEGIPAVMIGRLTDGNDRIIHNEEENRYLEMPQADEIHKVLG